MIEARTEANERFFATEAERIAELSLRLAERFSEGGRLLAVGASPQDRSDAHHVAVEFVHPVIVGKPALPAIALRPGELSAASRARGRCDRLRDWPPPGPGQPHDRV